MGQASEHEAQKRRAEELRSEIEELRHGGGVSAPSPREFTDEAAADAARHHSDAQE